MAYIRHLIWDTWNVVHIARHEVTPEEVEEVCHGRPVFRDSYKGRIIAIGPTAGGRMLTVALDPEEEAGSYYPVTARAASRKERRRYQLQGGGDNL